MSAHAWSATDMMTVAAARRLADGAVCFVGIGLPSTAANLARLSHAPNVRLIYESGTIGTKPSVLPLSIGDGELATTADTVVSTPEIFRYWLQGGRIDVGFLGGAQIDRFANLNTTVIGPYGKPKDALARRGWSTGDLCVSEGSIDHHAAEFTRVRIEARLRHVRRLLGGRRCARTRKVAW